MHSIVTFAGGEALRPLWRHEHRFPAAGIGSLRALPRKLDRRQEAQLVVQMNVLPSWLTLFDVIKGLFPFNIDQHSSGLRHLTDLRAQLCMAGRRHLQLQQSSDSTTGAGSARPVRPEHSRISA